MENKLVLNTDENISQNNTDDVKKQEDNNSINQLTLELFMNKNMYKKYISRTDPKKYTELQTHLTNIQTYKQHIIDLTVQLLEDPCKQVTTEVDDHFKIYIKSLIKHFQQQEIENLNEYNNDNDNVMFGNITDFSQPSNNNQMHLESFWGKNKVIKK